MMCGAETADDCLFGPACEHGMGGGIASQRNANLLGKRRLFQPADRRHHSELSARHQRVHGPSQSVPWPINARSAQDRNRRRHDRNGFPTAGRIFASSWAALTARDTFPSPATFRPSTRAPANLRGWFSPSPGPGESGYDNATERRPPTPNPNGRRECLLRITLDEKRGIAYFPTVAFGRWAARAAASATLNWPYIT